MNFGEMKKLVKEHHDLTKDRKALERKRSIKRLELSFYEKDPEQYTHQIGQLTEEILSLGNEIEKVQVQLDEIERKAVKLPW